MYTYVCIFKFEKLIGYTIWGALIVTPKPIPCGWSKYGDVET